MLTVDDLMGQSTDDTDDESDDEQTVDTKALEAAEQPTDDSDDFLRPDEELVEDKWNTPEKENVEEVLRWGSETNEYRAIKHGDCNFDIEMKRTDEPDDEFRGIQHHRYDFFEVVANE